MLSMLQLSELNFVDLIQQKEREVFLAFNCDFGEIGEILGQVIWHFEFQIYSCIDPGLIARPSLLLFIVFPLTRGSLFLVRHMLVSQLISIAVVATLIREAKWFFKN